ncbi:uncharacterized protein LOC128208310 [Mya arenaria]|uniref:uncharacterized protein LOC128208310 n=1 Tax=Mya arenaria TaxID=6604 RepID=UPI0022E491F9|nr:uncharacterized protein LOC128208310 [Mya arenaria]XP_052767839.1 uncharacterized protein LOC128208310 [Mya arenaria]XP_052767846.1 uncharacterized protein LOC128208310 [Mya arenaria]
MAYELGSGSVRGYAVLLAYEKFNNGANRTGGDKDLVNMKKIARDMRLEQINQGENNEKNLTKHQTLKVLEDARGILSQKNDCQMFVFIISTHGKELPNPSARGQKDHALSCSDGEMLFLNTDVVQRFNDHNCPTLKGKPKLFFIQACRYVDPTWYMVKGTELMNPDGRMLMSKDKTRISVVRNIDTSSKIEQVNIDLVNIDKIHTSKNSDNIEDSREFHLVLKDEQGTEEFIASTQDHADCWVIGLCDLMLHNTEIERVPARRIKKDDIVEVGYVTFQKKWRHVLWDICSSHGTGVSVGAGSQTSADSETMETGTKDETEADARGGGDSKPMQATPATKKLVPKNLSRSANENVFTLKCTDGSDITFQTKNLAETETADTWFNILTYVMHFSSHGTDEGVSVKVEDKIPSTKPDDQTKPDGETEDDASRTMPPEPTHFPIQVSEGTETNTKHLPIQESGNGSHAQQTVAVTNSPQTVPIIPPYNPHDRWGHGNKTYIKDPMPRGVKCNRDTLIMSAVPSGMMAWRDTENGSWLIACVKEALENEKQKKEMVNFMSVLTTVTSMMAGMETNTKHNNPAVHQMKAVPVIEHQLLKKLSV